MVVPTVLAVVVAVAVDELGIIYDDPLLEFLPSVRSFLYEGKNIIINICHEIKRLYLCCRYSERYYLV